MTELPNGLRWGRTPGAVSPTFWSPGCAEWRCPPPIETACAGGTTVWPPLPGRVIIGVIDKPRRSLIAHRRIRKCTPSDRMSAVAVAGTAGLALEMVRLFSVELEHYEKIEGSMLSLEGKANFLARLVRAQLPLAFQGLAVVPLFAGYDRRADLGRVYTFDVVGGRYEEHDYGAAGSGAVQARAYLRTAWRPQMSEDQIIERVMGALVAAADVDVATGGPDLRRGILPNLVVIDRGGVREISDDRLLEVATIR